MNKLDKALDRIEKGIELAEDVEGKLTRCTCVKEKMLAVTSACVVILRPACRPLAKILGVSACDSRYPGSPPSLTPTNAAVVRSFNCRSFEALTHVSPLLACRSS